MNINALISAAFGLAALLPVSSVAERPHNAREFALALRPIEPRIRVSTRPGFRLTLTNISERECRVLNVTKRVDLQHAYFALIVTKNGKEVRVPQAISDPGPISDADWVRVQPGATKTFTLKDFPQLYDKLPPGSYQAHVHFWPDPFQSHKTAYNSELATFTVTE